MQLHDSMLNVLKAEHNSKIRCHESSFSNDKKNDVLIVLYPVFVQCEPVA